MTSSTAFHTDQDTTPLARALADIAAIDKKITALNAEVDELKGRREHLERIAVEEMTAQRLDGVRVAGRSWRVEHDHYVSVTEDNRAEVLKAAEAAGWSKALVTVNTARLKALLKERAKEAGMDARTAYTEGTPFAGLVSEHVAPKLRHVTTG